MNDYIYELEELCGNVVHDLKKSNEKIRAAGGELSAGDVDYLDKLTHILKSIKTTIAMEDYDDGSYSGDGMRYDDRGSYNRRSYGSSYARGRRGNVRRDSMGRYSRDDAKEKILKHLRKMESEAKDSETKEMVRDWIEQTERD